MFYNELPTNCKNCGAPLNSEGKCEYCGAIYSPIITPIFLENPKATILTADVNISNDLRRHMNPDDLSDYTIQQLSRKLAEGLSAYMKLRTSNDYFTDSTIIRGEVRILPPDFRF